MSTVANKHPKNGRFSVDGSNLLIIEHSSDDNVPPSDCTHTEGNGWFVVGDEGGIQQITFEFTAIVLDGQPPDVAPGQIYAGKQHHGSKDINTAYDGTIYIESLRQQGQTSQTGPQVYTGRGTFSGTVVRPTA